ncbi:hypothetical protein OH77DRAFT_148469 [Trametes cingulata]|nr:hypothetical protein OH77DRAFT_148469 [Trametes cingulata]
MCIMARGWRTSRSSSSKYASSSQPARSQKTRGTGTVSWHRRCDLLRLADAEDAPEESALAVDTAEQSHVTLVQRHQVTSGTISPLSALLFRNITTLVWFLPVTDFCSRATRVRTRYPANPPLPPVPQSLLGHVKAILSLEPILRPRNTAWQRQIQNDVRLR